MPALLKASMPQTVDLGEGYTLQIAALKQSDGSAVPNVNISNMTIEVDALGSGTLDSGPFMFVPGPGA